MPHDFILLPAPQQLTGLEGTYTLNPEHVIWLGDGVPLPVGRTIQNALPTEPAITRARLTGSDVGVSVQIDPAQVPQPQGYTLTISGDGVRLMAHDEAGAFYGALTLAQIATQVQGTTLPALRVHDWPDFPFRGVMLDISRDKVPTLDQLFALIDLLASWKVNQFQLYTEHTFAYRQHKIVWENASPLTGEDILQLDAYCQERYVELVPNQNSFGHMLRWLKHKPYAHLAEAPEGYTYPWGEVSDEPFSIAPTYSGSIELIAELYEELLPHFSSGQFNVGCDETWDLGQPGTRSEVAVKEHGAGRIYLDFLWKVYELTRQHGRTMQYWGDIIIQHPDLIAELPQDAIALEWGYEADHPFAEHSAAFAQAGVPFYVCPGTSSWNTIAGRTDNALGNLWSAAENGLQNGAIGYLNTDWGDNGHWQPLPVSYLGFAYGAAVSWAAESNHELDIPRALDLFAFHDAAGVMGQFVYDLGNIYQDVGVFIANNSALHRLLLAPDQPLDQAGLGDLTAARLAEVQHSIGQLFATLDDTRMQHPEADLIKEEYKLAAGLMSHACALGVARLAVENNAIANFPAETRETLAEELMALIELHRTVWLARNQSGGLSDSVAELEKLLALYQA